MIMSVLSFIASCYVVLLVFLAVSIAPLLMVAAVAAYGQLTSTGVRRT